DASSWGGPSRTLFVHGIANTDWRNVNGGDGFEPQIDPTDPNIVYAQSQHAGLVRYDWRTTERVTIVPQPASGEYEYTWNWATPLLISPHNPRRLYIAAEKVFRSDDRGDNWQIISPDLTRDIDRNELPIMDRIWSMDALQKNRGVSRYGAAIALAESPLQEGLLYVGTDDGRISVTEDGGEKWRSLDRISGVPDLTYVEEIIASNHDVGVAYATLDNHKRGDYRPYVFVTRDKGKNWRSIAGNLPDRGSVHSIVEDHVDPNLLFVGTEFGLFFTQDGGKNWLPLRGNFPVISVRDLEIQRRENDLVVGTYGRGIYILDDYSPLRRSVESVTSAAATLFLVKDALLYIVGDKWNTGQAIGDVGPSGMAFFNSPNPPYGAVFTYFLRDGFETARNIRRTEERRVQKKGGDNPYPSWEDLRQEDSEQAPVIVFTIRDDSGVVVRRIVAPSSEGIHRVNWDLRFPAPHAVDPERSTFRAPWSGQQQGPLVLPGQYSVEMSAHVRNEFIKLADAQTFTVEELKLSPEAAEDRESLLAFQQKSADLFRRVSGASLLIREHTARIVTMRDALVRTPNAGEDAHAKLAGLSQRLADINILMSGDQSVQSRNEAAAWSLRRRAGSLLANWDSQSKTTGTERRAYEIAAEEFDRVGAMLAELDDLLTAFETEMNDLGAPWTPSRRLN
ncbi:MAG: glycosyl hydrolase, partial [Proteobacteria bacterium]|nr:glycosyl hydrolase [Pseudomonadota bacterium]